LSFIIIYIVVYRFTNDPFCIWNLIEPCFALLYTLYHNVQRIAKDLNHSFLTNRHSDNEQRLLFEKTIFKNEEKDAF